MTAPQSPRDGEVQIMCTCGARGRNPHPWEPGEWCPIRRPDETRFQEACPLCAGVDPVHISPIIQAHHAAHSPAPAETQQDCTEEMPCEVCADPEPELNPGDDCLGRYVPNEQDRKNWAALAARPSADTETLRERLENACARYIDAQGDYADRGDFDGDLAELWSYVRAALDAR